MKKELTQERLRELLHYEPTTGVFRWRISLSNRKPVGTIAGYIERHGYRCIRIEPRRYKAHRLVWLYVTGAWPKDQLDHINGVRTDNRVSNLREATRIENNRNSKFYANNTSGFRCVRWVARAKKWEAYIGFRGRHTYLGLFPTPEEASAAYEAARVRYFGEFRRTA